jgi:hypothetical protein
MKVHQSCCVVGSLLMTASVWAGNGAYFRMVPVQPQGANADPYPVGTTINEQTGTISFPGLGPQRVWIEVRYGDWGQQLDSLGLYQFGTVYFADTTGGLLQKASIPCSQGGPGEDERCRGLLGEGPPSGTGCLQFGFGNCVMAFPQWVDGDFRPDYLSGLSIFAADISQDRVRFGQVTNTACAIDDQTEKYAATMVLETTMAVAAPMDIPVAFEPFESFFGDCDQMVIEAGLLFGATIQFRGDECTLDAHCDDDDPCTVDTCNVGPGSCTNAPILGCPAETNPFTYQGSLENPPGMPVTDLCDFKFGLWDDQTAGNLVDVIFPHENPAVVSNVAVSGGGFTATLDYGPNVFDGDPRWLAIEVQCSGDPSFVPLSPRIPLLPTPYAMRALEGVGPPNGLYVSPAGDVGIGLNDPLHPLEMASGAHVTAGGVWTNASSRALKENFAPVNPIEILSRLVNIPIQKWNYRGEDDTVRHVAPTAEDFHAAFGLGGSDRHIGTIDADGVALAAIQGLHEIVQEKDCEIEELRERNRLLEARLEAIERAMTALTRDADKEGVR